jgi:hypothetical protein
MGEWRSCRNPQGAKAGAVKTDVAPQHGTHFIDLIGLCQSTPQTARHRTLHRSTPIGSKQLQKASFYQRQHHPKAVLCRAASPPSRPTIPDIEPGQNKVGSQWRSFK